MNTAVGSLLLLDFALIGLLPRVFFRRDGRLNARWWLTAAPFLASSAVLVLALLGRVPAAIPAGAAARTALDCAAAALAAASIGLLAFTLGTHRIPLALWHQEDDAPASIVTWGAYRRIRHPFYASFLLALLGAFALAPQPLTAATLVYGFLVLDRTAAREERRLRASQFAAEYEAYVQRTGRFWPRWR